MRISRVWWLAIGLVFFTHAGASEPLKPAAQEAPNRLAPVDVPGSTGNNAPVAPWIVQLLPSQRLPTTQFSWPTVNQQTVLAVRAAGSYGNLVHPLDRLNASGARLSWRWRLEEANAQIDLAHREGDDTNLKICVLWDLPMSAVPMSERFLLQIARQRTGEPLPAATICYVWDTKLARDSARDNVYSRRVRYLVLRGPADSQRAWQQEERDISADFRRLFGDEAKEVPPMIGVAVGADADNTRERSLAYLSGLSLTLGLPSR